MGNEKSKSEKSSRLDRGWEEEGKLGCSEGVAL